MQPTNATRSIVDLRSDTVTRPDAGMRRAIAAAAVGDDTLGDDPTAIELERHVAELLGKEAAIFFPSGIMANQTAILVLTEPGTEVVLDADAHIVHYEESAAAALAGVQLRGVRSDGGIPAPDLIAEAIRPASPYMPVTRLVCLENTHNSAGGRVVPIDTVREIAAIARQRGVALHLDGARLPNAAVASGIEMGRWAESADTVMLSLSKGLGAPIGSMLAGDRMVIDKARRVRRRLGGGMRQVGLIAAAGLYALRNNFERLAVDHARAATLARRLAGVPGLLADQPETNIVMIDVDPDVGTARALVTAAARQGVRTIEFGTQRVRAVIHKDIDDTDIDTAAAVVEGAVAQLRG